MGVVAGYAVPHPPLIVPQVGRGEERGIDHTVRAYEEVARRVAALAPDTVVVSSPHAPAYRDAFAVAPGPVLEGDMAQFRAPEVRVSARVDADLVKASVKACEKDGPRLSERAWQGAPMDYAALIPLWFLQKAIAERGGQTGLPDVVEVGLSGLSAKDHFVLGKKVADAAGSLGRRVVWIASGDMSHKLTEDGPYGFDPAGPRFDKEVCRLFAAGDLDGLFHLDPGMCHDAAYCGLPSWQMMAGALDGAPVTARLLSYEGPFGVGYGVAAFEGKEAAGLLSKAGLSPLTDARMGVGRAGAPAPEAPGRPHGTAGGGEGGAR